MTKYERETLQWIQEQEQQIPKRYLVEIITGMNQRWLIIPGLEKRRYFPSGYCSEAAALWCLLKHPGQYFIADEKETRELWRLFLKEKPMDGHNDDSTTLTNTDLYLMRKRDTERPMGVYTKVEAWPPEGELGSSSIFSIEQVHGDRTVDTITVGIDEAIDLAKDILEKAAKVTGRSESVP